MSDRDRIFFFLKKTKIKTSCYGYSYGEINIEYTFKKRKDGNLEVGDNIKKVVFG